MNILWRLNRRGSPFLRRATETKDDALVLSHEVSVGNGMVLLEIAVFNGSEGRNRTYYVNGNTTMLGYIRKTSDANVLKWQVKPTYF